MKTDGDAFRSYLDVQGRFDRYSVTNAILVAAQKPDAVQQKDYKKRRETIDADSRLSSRVPRPLKPITAVVDETPFFFLSSVFHLQKMYMSETMTSSGRMNTFFPLSVTVPQVGHA